MEALRDLAEGPTEAVPTCEAARPRRDAAMAFEALKADGRQVQAPRPRALGKLPPRGRTTGCRPTSARTRGGNEVRPGGDGRLHPGGCRETSAEQERRDGGPGHQARHAGADGGRRELCGHDRPGNEFATLDRELPEAVHQTKRPEDRNATAVVDRGIQTLKKDLPQGWRARAGRATTLSGRPGPTTRGPTRRCTARPRTWRSSRPQSSGSFFQQTLLEPHLCFKKGGFSLELPHRGGSP